MKMATSNTDQTTLKRLRYVSLNDKLPSQSWVVACLSYRELHALKSLGHTFWPLSHVQVSECFVKIPVKLEVYCLFS